MQFHIQSDSEIPASTQLFNQIWFAIASGQIPPGQRLPSTRQLAMQTGLHRNTISKVYDRLEAVGLVAAQIGSGIYVRDLAQESASQTNLADVAPPTSAYKLVQQSLDELINLGCSLNQAREFFNLEIDRRLRAGTQVLVTVPRHDLGAGELMVQELQQALLIPVLLVPLEELGVVLAQGGSGTVVTSRYFTSQVEAVLSHRQSVDTTPQSVRVISLDIYDYTRELKLIKALPKGISLGLVSLSSGTLDVAKILIHSLRGEDLLIMTAQLQDSYKLRALIRNAHTIISDQASFSIVKAAVLAARDELIRLPQIIRCESYIDSQSISLLKRELGSD